MDTAAASPVLLEELKSDADSSPNVDSRVKAPPALLRISRLKLDVESRILGDAPSVRMLQGVEVADKFRQQVAVVIATEFGKLESMVTQQETNNEALVATGEKLREEMLMAMSAARGLPPDHWRWPTLVGIGFTDDMKKMIVEFAAKMDTYMARLGLSLERVDRLADQLSAVLTKIDQQGATADTSP